MSLEDEDDDAPRTDYYQFLPIGLAALLTAAAIGLCFFTFTVPPEKPAAAAPAVARDSGNGEVMIGVGGGSTIHQSQTAADPHKRP
jgi:hypothetical protein